MSRTRSATPSAVRSAASEIVPPGGRVLGGVVEQVREDLREPRPIGVERGPAPRAARPAKRCPRASIAGRAVSTRALDDVVEERRLGLERDLAVRDARHVEQVVDEARELLRLALGDLERAIAVAAAGAHEVERLVSGASGFRSSCASIARNSSLRRSAAASSPRARCELVGEPLRLR